jgi:glycosyltransferase involved in cell wall biosynthesis
MKILFILSTLPYPKEEGLAVINYRLLTRAQEGAEIDLLYTGEKRAALEQLLKRDAPQLCSITAVPAITSLWRKSVNSLSVYLTGKVVYKNRKLHAAVKHAIRTQEYDLLYVCPITMISDIPEGCSLPPVFLNAVDSIAALAESMKRYKGTMANRWKVVFYRAYERRFLSRAARINFVSSAEAEQVGRRVNRSLPIVHIPLGIDVSQFYHDPSAIRQKGTLVFSGNFDYCPNVEAAQYLSAVLFPELYRRHPQLHLYIIGRNPPRLLAHPGITVTGFVESICEWYNRCEIFLCPLHIGSGIKNKILEAMACRLPVISTSTGVSGTRLTDGVHFLLANSREEQLGAIEKLLTDTVLRTTLTNNAALFIKENYNWDKSIARYYDEFNRLIKHHRV